MVYRADDHAIVSALRPGQTGRPRRQDDMEVGDEQRSQPVRRAEGKVEPTATLEEVDILAQLLSRRHRPPNHESENRALAVLDRADLVIISLSGYGSEEDRLRSKQAGCDSHLVKPVDPGALRTVLDRAALVGRMSHAEPAAQHIASRLVMRGMGA